MSTCNADEIFRLFTLPPSDFHKQFLIIDVRDHKVFNKKGHINQVHVNVVRARTRMLTKATCTCAQCLPAVAYLPGCMRA